MPSLRPKVVIPLHGDGAKERRHLQGPPPHPRLPGPGLELGVDLVDSLLEHGAKVLPPDQQYRLPKLLLPLEHVPPQPAQHRLQEALDFLLQCRL